MKTIQTPVRPGLPLLILPHWKKYAQDKFITGYWGCTEAGGAVCQLHQHDQHVIGHTHFWHGIPLGSGHGAFIFISYWSIECCWTLVYVKWNLVTKSVKWMDGYVLIKIDILHLCSHNDENKL